MRDLIRDFGGLIVVIIICLGLCIGIIYFGDKYNNSKTYTSQECEMGEWISPDGVHYWIGTHGYKGYLAPRYDSNGNLVIDK